MSPNLQSYWWVPMTIATDEFRRHGVSDEYLFHSTTSEFRCALLPMSSNEQCYRWVPMPKRSVADKFRCQWVSIPQSHRWAPEPWCQQLVLISRCHRWVPMNSATDEFWFPGTTREFWSLSAVDEFWYCSGADKFFWFHSSQITSNDSQQRHKTLTSPNSGDAMLKEGGEGGV